MGQSGGSPSDLSSYMQTQQKENKEFMSTMTKQMLDHQHLLANMLTTGMQTIVTKVLYYCNIIVLYYCTLLL
jgi:hypothetical protein